MIALPVLAGIAFVVAALVIAVLPTPRTAQGLTVAASAVALGVSVMWLLGPAESNGALQSDALARVVLCVTTAAALAAALLSVRTMPAVLTDATGRRRYWVSFNLFMASITAVPLAANLAWMWIAIEATTAFSVLLIATSGTRAAVEAAWRYVLLTLAGAAIALFGILLFAGIEGHSGDSPLTWDGAAQAIAHMPTLPTRAALLLIVVGLGAKVGLVPLHTWIAGAYAEAPLPICILFSGAEAMAVAAVLLRVTGLAGTVSALAVEPWVMVLGLLTVAVGALLIVQAHDLRRLFAYSSIEQVGVIMVGGAIGSRLAFDGAVVQLMGQAFTKAVCFGAVALVAEWLGTVELRQLGGMLGASGHRTGVFLLAAGSIAIAGVPPSLLFLGEFTILRAAVDAHLYVAAGVLALFLSISSIALLGRIGAGLAGRQTRPAPARPSLGAARLLVEAPLAALACAMLVAGVVLPPALTDLIQRIG